jgi:radical SAM superfamily enzyme YgiQ (UPF0313 family)
LFEVQLREFRRKPVKTKILLVFPPYIRQALSDFQPIGISYIASYILNKNPSLNVKLIDYTVEKFTPERWRKELEDFEPEVVGISILSVNYASGMHIARLTKEFNPDIVTVMGGVHATMEPDKCLDCCDIVVRGEGEATFFDLLQDYELDSIKGISFRRDGKVLHNEPREHIQNLDDLPFPAHSLFKMERYKGFPSWGIMGSRGCPYKCTFCSSPYMWDSKIRFRSAKNIVGEIEHLYNEFGIQSITFFDDTINIPQRRAIELCDEIVKRDLQRKISFVCQMRVNRPLVSLELFRKMKEANFVHVAFGIENGSEKVLRSMRKSFKPQEAKEAIKMARKAGINRVEGFFMVGNWDETIWDVLKTWRFILCNNVEPAFSICVPFPGTDFYHLSKRNGYIGDDPDWNSFNQVTPVVRTNTMSKFSITIVYVFSIFLKLILAFVRGRNARQTMSQKIMPHLLDKIKQLTGRIGAAFGKN